MENREEKIGCSTGRVTIVDPNNSNGFNSSSNMSVPLEDLNLSVVLRTFRKGRTVLSKEDNGGVSESSQNIAINFIEGSKINGEKILTTKFTDLTTSFENGTFNDETLGITDIDIDFNPSMAPMINIKFIDVRGSSIFQNEENLSGNNSGNKYSTFFQLPYPLFELEIKGYYGKPVTYCLHMLKFTSLFNSKTGNFEIQCQFIGYTYAMLSDLLIGYLKAIPYTKIGAEKYRLMNDKRKNPILNLNELMQAIGKINQGVIKLSSTSENAKSKNSIENAKELLDKIKGTIQNLGSSIEYLDTTKTDYNYIIKSKDKSISETDDSIVRYNEIITKQIEEFNSIASNVINLNVNDFTDLTSSGYQKGFYKNLSLKILNDGTNDSILSGKIGSSIGLNKFKEGVRSDISNYFSGQSDEFVFDVYDLNSIQEKIRKAIDELYKTENLVSKSLADELKSTFVSELSFEPTVRNIVEIFTVAIEVMMESIYAVSTSAEDSGNYDRKNELEKVFGKDLSNSSDIKENALKDKKYFAWPDYREKNDNRYVDKYLGSPGVLENPYKVNEVSFIDDLLLAFIKAKEVSDDVEEFSEQEIKTWVGINPLDSYLYNNVEPYLRRTFNNDQEIIRMAVQRGMTFLSYSNDSSFFPSDNKEILAMAEIEADAILRNIKNPKLIQSLTQLTSNSIKNIKIDIGGDYVNLLKTDNQNYYYNFLDSVSNNSINNFTVIPLSDSFDGYWPTDISSLKAKAGWDNESNSSTNSIFLTNYSQEETTNGSIDKPIDGSMFVKIISADKLTDNKKLYGTINLNTDSKFSLEKLKSSDVEYNAGYNSFGGSLGIQEYKNMDFGGSVGDKLPLMYVFYKDTHIGLSSPRKTGIASIYDIKKNKNEIEIPNNKEMFFGGGKKTHNNVGKNRDLFSEIINGNTDVSYPYFEQPAYNVPFIELFGGEYRNPYDTNSFSLFGSKFYYGQSKSRVISTNGDIIGCENYSKAFLFLNNLPWNLERGNPFKKNEIINLFNKKSGFIHAPRLWTAWVGSILWRLSKENPIIENNKIIGGGSGISDPIEWLKNGISTYNGENPDRDEFLQWLEWGSVKIGNYNDIDKDDILNRIPEQIAVEFKKAFFSFVNGDDEMITWSTLKNGLEIYNGNSTDFNKFYDNFIYNTSSINNKSFVRTDVYNDPKLNTEPYKIITHIKLEDKHSDYLALELDGTYATNEVVKNLIDAMMQEVVIVNSNYKVWTNNSGNFSLRSGFGVPIDKFNQYFSKLTEVLKTKGDSYSPSKVKKNAEQEIFGTSDESVIKLILYTTCKNIHDKWLAGVTDPNNLIFQCGDSSGRSIRNNTDEELSIKYGNDKPRLIDSFRFVSRSFKDIGDKLFINPLPINDFLIKTPNVSSYDAISSLLDANKFTFDALPTFINYKDPSNLEAMFKPMPNYEQAIENGSCGPSFVCVYAGQTSKHLDFIGSEYKNDGFDFSCNGGSLSTSVPNDFTENISSGEDPVAVFKVGYGQQNQNIFKDITLDQNEFTETDESLQIQDEISQKGSETNRSLAGQNIYNVYSVRSYSAQVEMMGNAMIQPMMYFQLDNIPMFHGAYMITRVKHSLKPNTMSTNFTGVRIRHGETPLITAMDLFMSLADTINTSKAGDGQISGNIKGSFSPIVSTIVENGVINGDINGSGNIKFTKVPNISGVIRGNSRPEESVLLTEAVVPFQNMMTDLVEYMKGQNFKNPKITYTSMYRTYEHQQVMYKQNGGLGTANVGTSNHGWGIAVDLLMLDENGNEFKITPKTGSKKENFDFKINKVYGWLIKNGYRYGWVNPAKLRDGVNLEEHWHFEYHGKSAQCIMNENKVVYGQSIDTSSPIFDFVKNPKEPTGNEAVYVGCKTVYVETKIEVIEKNTIQSEKQLSDNQITVKNKLKSIGLTKEQVAGVMGNMLQESSFNPLALNKRDRNGKPSFGLIQWNGKYYSQSEVGKTIETQLNFLLEMKSFKKFVDYGKTKNSVEDSSYEFAKIVEICHLCNLGFKTYSESYQYVRTSYGKDFLRRFNTKTDSLFW